MTEDFNRVVILADYGNLKIAEKVHKELQKREMHGGLEPFDPEALYINRFNNGEVDTYIKSSVRGRDVFLIKSFNVYPKRWDKDKRQHPVPEELAYQPNEGIAELFALNHALKMATARRVTNVILHMPFQRQDRRPKRKGAFTRGPISAKLYADLLKNSGADCIITLDPHFKQIEGFFDIPCERLESFVLFTEYIENNFADKMDKVTFVAPDHGAVENARDYSKFFNRPMVIIDKRRTEEGKSKVIEIIGSQEDLDSATAILIDDLIDTGGTIRKAGKAILDRGAKEFIVCCTHPVLSGNAKDKLLADNIKLITTDSILIKDLDKYKNIKILDTSFLVAGAIECICNGQSISHNLADYREYREKKKKSNNH